MSTSTGLSQADIERMVTAFQRAVEENPEGVERAVNALVEQIGNALGAAVAAVGDGIRDGIANLPPEQKVKGALALKKAWTDIAVAQQNKEVEDLVAQLRQGR